MIHSQSRRHPSVMTRRRANPAGLGRLLAIAATLGLMTLGHGVSWWLGLLLLTLILAAIGQAKKAWRKAWPLLGIITAISFAHLHVIPLWTGITFAVLAAAQWSLSILL